MGRIRNALSRFFVAAVNVVARLVAVPVLSASAWLVIPDRRKTFVPIAGRVGRVIGRHSLTVAARPERVREVRRFVVAALGPEHPCLDAATEVASELATNALLYGSADEDATIKVRVRSLRHHRVCLTVIDKGGTGHAPTLKAPDGEELNGRGLVIVNALACRWDWAPYRGGHKVRALLDPLSPGAHEAVAQPLDLDDFLALNDAMDGRTDDHHQGRAAGPYGP